MESVRRFFLNTLAGYHDLAAGTLKLGQIFFVRLAYYRQLDQDLPGDMDFLATGPTQIADNFVSPRPHQSAFAQMLEQFTSQGHGSNISSLSGGETSVLPTFFALIQNPTSYSLRRAD